MTALPDMICITHGIPACKQCEGKAMNQLEQLQQAARFALEVLLWSQAGEPVPSMEREAIKQLKTALIEPVQEPVAWADKAMELATDFAIESLRVSSHERKDSLLNNVVYTWETSMLRDKREAARDRLRQYLYTAPIQRKPLTDEEINNICAQLGFAQLSPVEVARAIEQQHGIV